MLQKLFLCYNKHMNENLLGMHIEQWQFAGDEKECNFLFDLVKAGRKTATSWLYDVNDKVEVFSVLTNWDGSEKILLATKKFEIKRFCEVSKEHAYKEGEGDRSLKEWQKNHKKFFQSECSQKGFDFDENTLIACEEFEVLEVDYGRKKV